ncbi:MAG: XRE family transcriptional regulator [Hyphomicrobiales bacterium]|nr:MAG: XRE family transcriptional regulator [Hyphomicrobiales bacterium]
MMTLGEFSQTLAAAQKERGVSAVKLGEATGLSPQAVRQILSGEAAPRVTNAMALASELGLELVLLPKAVAQSMGGAAESERKVISDVERRIGLSRMSPPPPSLTPRAPKAPGK